MRLPLERIMEGKSRRLTFQRRWIGLRKKAEELSILCGVDVCLIIFAASSDDRPSEPIFWPPNPEHVRAIVRRYKEHGKGKRLMTKTPNSSKKGVSRKLGTQEAEFPTVLDERFDGLSVHQWKELLKFWEAKLEKVRSRIHQLRKMRQDEDPNFTDIPRPASVPHLSATVDCSFMEPDFLSTSTYFFGGPSGSDCNTIFSPPSPENINIVYSNADGVAASSSSSTCSSWPAAAMPPYNYYGYPAQYSMAAAPIQSLPLQMNTETWEQYLVDII